MGATPVGAGTRSRRPRWLVPLLIGVAAMVVVVLLLTQCGSDDQDDATGASDSTSAEGAGAAPTGSSPSAVAEPAPATAGQPGAVIADGTSLLPLAAASDPTAALAPFEGQSVQASAVRVLSVPADEGFWLGTSESERLWVQLTGAGESPYQVQPGDRIDLRGTLVAHAEGFAQQVGVLGDEGARLDAQRYHLQVDKTAVSLSR